MLSLVIVFRVYHQLEQVSREDYTPLTKLLARWARPSKMYGGSRKHAEKYPTISATNQCQISSKMYQWNLQSFFV